jgi:hypothetical protein
MVETQDTKVDNLFTTEDLKLSMYIPSDLGKLLNYINR